MFCGVGDYTYALALALAQSGEVDVRVVTSIGANPGKLPSKLEVLPVVKSWRLHEVIQVLREVRSWRPDLVHIQLPSVAYGDKILPYLLPLCVRLVGIRVVQTWHFCAAAPEIFRLMPFKFLCSVVVPGILFTVHESYEKRMAIPFRWLFRRKFVKYIPTVSAIQAVELSGSQRSELRAKYTRTGCFMVVYFGFLYPGKGVEQLFEIADASESQLVIVGGSFSGPEVRVFPKFMRTETAGYADSIRRLAETDKWRGKVTLTGFLPPGEVAQIIASADAVVLPFLAGSNTWNTSVYAVQAQGTFLLTTSKERRGYDTALNTYFAMPGDIDTMKTVLRQYAGQRATRRIPPESAWQSTSNVHLRLYKTQISGGLESVTQ